MLTTCERITPTSAFYEIGLTARVANDSSGLLALCAEIGGKCGDALAEGVADCAAREHLSPTATRQAPSQTKPDITKSPARKAIEAFKSGVSDGVAIAMFDQLAKDEELVAKLSCSAFGTANCTAIADICDLILSEKQPWLVDGLLTWNKTPMGDVIWARYYNDARCINCGYAYCDCGDYSSGAVLPEELREFIEMIKRVALRECDLITKKWRSTCLKTPLRKLKGRKEKPSPQTKRVRPPRSKLCMRSA